MVLRAMLADDVSRRLEDGAFPEVETGCVLQRCLSRCLSEVAIVEGLAERGYQARQLTTQDSDVGLERNRACQYVAIPVGNRSACRGIAHRLARFIHECDEPGIVSTHGDCHPVMRSRGQGRRNPSDGSRCIAASHELLLKRSKSGRAEGTGPEPGALCCVPEPSALRGCGCVQLARQRRVLHRARRRPWPGCWRSSRSPDRPGRRLRPAPRLPATPRSPTASRPPAALPLPGWQR